MEYVILYNILIVIIFQKEITLYRKRLDFICGQVVKYTDPGAMSSSLTTNHTYMYIVLEEVGSIGLRNSAAPC